MPNNVQDIMYMVDLFYANKHLYQKIQKKEKERERDLNRTR